MSELKVHKAYNRWLDEEMPTPNDDLICNEVYLKSEADKFIADLEESHKMEVEQLLMEIVGLKKLVETADKLLKPKGGFTIKDVTFGGVELEGIKTHKKGGGKVMARDCEYFPTPSHDDEVARLKYRIAELETLNHDLEEERRWRKFPDEKPEEWATIFVRFSDGFYDLAVYMSNGQGWDIGDGLYHKPEEVSHWMPLPSAPKEQA